MVIMQILDEVQSRLAAELPSVFSPGVPAVFHANYQSAMRFVSELEGLCQGRTALDRLRASPAYAAFLKRWNTSVYFSLLYQVCVRMRVCRWGLFHRAYLFLGLPCG